MLFSCWEVTALALSSPGIKQGRMRRVYRSAIRLYAWMDRPTDEGELEFTASTEQLAFLLIPELWGIIEKLKLLLAQ